MDQITNYGPNRPMLGAFFAVTREVDGKDMPVAVFPVYSEAAKAKKLFNLGGPYLVPVLDISTRNGLDRARGLLR